MKRVRVAPLWCILAGYLAPDAAHSQPVCTTEGALDRCVHPPGRLPRFFTLFGEQRGVKEIDPGALPFNRSVAVLVGVSSYEHSGDFRPITFVQNDVRAMKDYLLGPGGFDEVLSLQDERVSASAIESLMLNRMPTLVTSSDRLLFYFSGHGFDFGGTTGYFAFRSAQRGHYNAEAMVAVSRVLEWSKVLPARHILFLLDSCSSGLGIEMKEGNMRPTPEIVLSTLARNGSRAIITAGTADERAVSSSDGKSSLFTRAFLAILTKPSQDTSYSGLLTVQSVFGKLYDEVSTSAGLRGGKMTPRQWDRLEDTFRGSFLFLAPGPSTMSRDVLNALGARSMGATEAFPQPRTWRDVALRYALQRVSAQRIVVDLGRTPAGPRMVPLGVENHSGEAVEVSVRPEGNGLNPAFPGGSWSARLSGRGQADLQVSVDPSQLETGSRLAVLGGGTPLVSVSFRATIVPASERVAVDSGPRPSGAGSSFSPAYELCANAPAADLELEQGGDGFHLTGDRSCGAWAECQRTISETGRVCWTFRLQGHNELMFSDGVRASEGHLVATFRRSASPIMISAQPD